MTVTAVERPAPDTADQPLPETGDEPGVILSETDHLFTAEETLAAARSSPRRHGVPGLSPVWSALRTLGYASIVYGLRLKGQFPSRLLASPGDLWPGNPSVGEAIAMGIFRHQGHETSGDVPDFTDTELPQDLRAWLHSFAWLRDLASLNDVRVGRAVAEPALKEWLVHYSRWDALAWRPDVIGRRLISLINHAPLVLASQDLVYRSRALNAMAQQSRHLARCLDMAPPGLPRVTACVGLAFSSLLLPNGSPRLVPALRVLEAELDALLLADGWIESRDPDALLDVLRLLITLRDGYRAARKTPPTMLQVNIDKASAALKGLVQGKAGLAAFNGGRNGDARAVAATLDLAESAAAPLLSGRMGGYQRLQAGDAVVIADTGLPPHGALSTRAHAGMMAITAAHGDQPLFVNCGHLTDDFDVNMPREALRATAAHGAITINDTNAAKLLPSGEIGRAGKAMTCGRGTNAGGEALAMHSDCYARRHGVTIGRALWLRGDGDVLIGRDTLETVSAKAPRKTLRADVRFHIHPAITLSITGGGAGALLRLPDKSWWTFKAEGASVAIEPSLYLASGTAYPAQQLVLSLPLEGAQTTLRWALVRGETLAGLSALR